jgi:hypothetical protein
MLLILGYFVERTHFFSKIGLWVILFYALDVVE